MGLVQPINSHFSKSWICQIMHLAKTHQWRKKAFEWCQLGPTSKLDSNSRISLFDLWPLCYFGNSQEVGIENLREQIKEMMINAA